MRFLRLKLNISHLSDGGAVCKQRFLKYSSTVSDICGTASARQIRLVHHYNRGVQNDQFHYLV
jgi:hypothetical protein